MNLPPQVWIWIIVIKRVKRVIASVEKHSKCLKEAMKINCIIKKEKRIPKQLKSRIHIKNQMKKKQEKSCEMKNESRNGDEVDRLANDTNPSRNPFSDSQKFVRQLLDASLLAANVSQLRVVIGGSSENNYFWPLIIMISLAIFCHLAFGILMIQRWRSEREARKIHANKDDKKDRNRYELRQLINLLSSSRVSYQSSGPQVLVDWKPPSPHPPPPNKYTLRVQ
ncbi:uncharacterized protein LOC133193044 [Saccostrea echinata]|uniref:uncharacterized protein LOC133193044 n=1 Tax=Saccostrea echinata TaxID=191078 RepID=UPI002A7F539F|nr:uncharacterized protein LOC133193044 [Saccostrea echinata]